MPKRWSLQGKVVVVTGGSAGIGRETAIACARRGARVVLAARRADRLEEAAGAVRAAGGEAFVVPADVAVPGEVERLVHGTVEHWGTVDVLVSNAGFGIAAPVVEHTPEQLARIFAVNVFAGVYLMRAALPFFRHQGRGHLIQVASAAAVRNLPNVGVYSATKAAQASLSEALRDELSLEPEMTVHVTTAFPFPTETDFFEAAEKRPDGVLRPFGRAHPVRPVAESIARAADRTRPPRTVVPYVWGRPGFLLTQLAPPLGDWVMRRYLRALRARGEF